MRDSRKPKVDLIIYVKDAADTIGAALDSVRCQIFENITCIVVDGCSTDGTQAILESRKKEIDKLIIEPDDSAAEAANKGLAVGDSEIVCFLMADDFLKPNAIMKIAEVFQKNPEVEFLSSGVEVVVKENLAPYKVIFTRRGEGNRLTLKNILGTPYSGACYFRRSLLERHGGFNTKFKYAHDRDLLMRIFLNQTHSAFIDEPLYVYLSHSKSSTLSLNANIASKFLHEHNEMADEWMKKTSDYNLRKKIFCWQALQIKEKIFIDIRLNKLFENTPALLYSCLTNPLSLCYVTSEISSHICSRLLTSAKALLGYSSD